SGIALLAALVVAALNAARGRWDVWSDPARPTFADRGDGGCETREARTGVGTRRGDPAAASIARGHGVERSAQMAGYTRRLPPAPPSHDGMAVPRPGSRRGRRWSLRRVLAPPRVAAGLSGNDGIPHPDGCRLRPPYGERGVLRARRTHGRLGTPGSTPERRDSGRVLQGEWQQATAE